MATRKPNGLTFASMGTKQTAKQAAKRAGARKITYWSFSLYNTYNECPLKAKLRAIDKIKEPGNEHMDRGNDVHKLCEDYIKGLITLKQLKDSAKTVTLRPWDPTDVLSELTRMRKVYANRNKLAAHAMQPAVEDTWAFTKDWDQTVWNDWVGCWVRIKLDVGEFFQEGKMVIYVPTDWKTGRFYEDKNEEYIEQLELYALGALLMYPQIDEVRPRLAYVDQGLIYPDPDEPLVFTRADLEPLKKLWAKRTKAMLNDTRFAPRPGSYCRRCFHRASNKAAGGGQCKY